MLFFLQLIRIKNLILLTLLLLVFRYSLIVPALSICQLLPGFHLILLISAILFITAGGYIINDIYDIEIDKINRPAKLVVSQHISIQSARKLYYLLTISGLISGIYIAIVQQNTFTFIIFCCTPLLLYFYAKRLKKMYFWGNLLVALLTVLPLILVAVNEFDFIQVIKTGGNRTGNDINELVFWTFFLSLFAFLLTLTREIIKDIEDIEGDRQFQCKTIPVVSGINFAALLARNILIITVLILCVSVFYFFILDKILLICYIFAFLLLPVLYVIYLTGTQKKNSDFTKISRLLKLIMLAGVLLPVFNLIT